MARVRQDRTVTKTEIYSGRDEHHARNRVYGHIEIGEVAFKSPKKVLRITSGDPKNALKFECSDCIFQSILGVSQIRYRSAAVAPRARLSICALHAQLVGSHEYRCVVRPNEPVIYFVRPTTQHHRPTPLAASSRERRCSRTYSATLEAHNLSRSTFQSCFST
eukprot:183512-Pleurochrysis_carterae.AAC.5